MTQKKIIRPVIIAVILMVIVGITGYISVNHPKDETPTEPSSDAQTETVDTQLNMIEGGYSFFPDDVLPADADPTMYTLPPAVCGIDLPYTVSNTPFVVTRIAKYSGAFVEDMSDEEVENCLAIIVKNNTDDLVMTGTLVFKVNDSEQAVFKVNTLPAGKSCVVLEQSRRPFSSGEVLKYDADNSQNEYYSRTSEEQSEISVTDKIQVSGAGNSVTIRNRGGDTYESLRVLYKNVQEGIYLGGVTYMLEFDDVALGMEMTKNSLHYNADQSEVITVDNA